MMSPPRLTDREALQRNRVRAARAPVLFLHERVAGDIEERLAEVNRRFTAPAVVTPFPQVWSARMPTARLVADSPVLALSPGAHDLVVHALCMHWADDPLGQILQAVRAMRPDGLFLAALFGGRTLHELRACLAEAEAELAGGLSPRVLPMGELRDLGGLLQRAGLALPVADSDRVTVTYPDAFALMRELRGMGEGNALAARRRNFARRSVFVEAAARYSAAFPAPGGRIRATFEVIHLAGWSPGPGQPRPMRPGTAQIRLAEALGTEERRLPDRADPGRD